MKPALANVLTGFVGLGDVGARFLPQLGAAITGITGKFKSWVEQNSQVGGTIEKLITGAIQGFKDLAAIVGNVGSILGSVFTGLGGQISSPLASIRELTGQLAEFLKTASAQDGLRALGECWRCSVGDADGLMSALKELAPLLVDLAPAAKALALGFGDFAQALIESQGRRCAGWRPSCPKRVPAAGTGAARRRWGSGLKGFKVITQTSVGAVARARGRGDASRWSRRPGRAACWRCSGGRRCRGLAFVAVELDKVNVAAAGGEQNLQGFERNLNNIVGAGKQLLSGDFGGIFADINTQLEQTGQTWSQGQAPVQ